jgi:hypothetical protein
VILTVEPGLATGLFRGTGLTFALSGCISHLLHWWRMIGIAASFGALVGAVSLRGAFDHSFESGAHCDDFSTHGQFEKARLRRANGQPRDRGCLRRFFAFRGRGVGTLSRDGETGVFLNFVPLSTILYHVLRTTQWREIPIGPYTCAGRFCRALGAGIHSTQKHGLSVGPRRPRSARLSFCR